MTTIPLVALAVAVSVAAALLLSRRLAPSPIQPILPDDLIPGYDPLLALVLRANQAAGVWVADTGPGSAPARGAVDTRLGRATEQLVTARLERLGQAGGQGTEILEQGALIHRTDAGRVAVLLLTGVIGEARMAAAHQDLADLLARMRREPVLEALGREQGRPGESVESVAMRLAHQLERLLDAEVGVALARPQGVQVMGVSLRSDPRLMLALAAPGSALDRVGRGIVAGPLISDDPLGRAGSERRRARPRAVVLPIPGKDLTVGAVVVATAEGALPPGPLRGELLQILEVAGPRLARALDRQELHETSVSDPLTGLRNRRGLGLALERAGPAGGAMVHADLDRFKSLNDTLGHPAGDAALVHFARLVGQSIRSGDVVGRIGGEEFAIWLPGATLAEGTATAERIRAGLEHGAWAWQGKPWSLTASFGVASCPETVASVGGLAVEADRALYQAKESGRNRVVVAERQ